MGDEAAPAEAVRAGEDDGVVEDAEADGAGELVEEVQLGELGVGERVARKDLRLRGELGDRIGREPLLRGEELDRVDGDRGGPCGVLDEAVPLLERFDHSNVVEHHELARVVQVRDEARHVRPGDRGRVADRRETGLRIGGEGAGRERGRNQTEGRGIWRGARGARRIGIRTFSCFSCCP